MLFVNLAGMIKNHVKALLKRNFSFEPTDCQSHLMDGLADFIVNQEHEEDTIFMIRGFAGTGKTSMIHMLAQTLMSLKINVVLMAPTGRAAKVMAGYTFLPAFTIHKKIYRQQSSSDGKGRFVPDRNLYRNTWFIVDEASMISNHEPYPPVFGSGKVLDDLLAFVYSGPRCRLVLTGDTAQLPPVGLSVSPALEVPFFEKCGFSVREFVLTEVVRQTAHSGILSCATQIRKRIDQKDASGFFVINTEKFPDVSRISGSDLMESISTCYEKYGVYQTLVITRSNKRANLYNNGIRSSILYRENEIERGDLLMVVKNNYYWSGDESQLGFIANGDIAEVIRINKYETLYGFRFADVCLRFIDYGDLEFDCKIFLDTLSVETACFTGEQQRKLFDSVSEDYAELRSKRNRWEKIRENPYYNALQVKYAYALTCHKAQGGQWKAVFVDQGWLVEDMLDLDYYRWLYTAFTRPVEKLFLVNFAKEFFNENEVTD